MVNDYKSILKLIIRVFMTLINDTINSFRFNQFLLIFKKFINLADAYLKMI